MSRARYAELRAQFGKLDPERVRMRVHVMLPSVSARQRFDSDTAGLQFQALVDAAALYVARIELINRYRDEAEREERGVAFARVQLIRKVGGGER